MTGHPLEVLNADVAYGEGPRWQDDRLWLADTLAGRVITIDAVGQLAVVGEIPTPAGLGFRPDGVLVVSSLAEPTLFQLADAGFERWADLGAHGVSLNDMVASPSGNLYVDVYTGDTSAGDFSGGVIWVAPDGCSTLVDDGLESPNGLVLTPDGATLLVAVTFGERIMAYDVEPSGRPVAPRVWASLPGRAPDGICLDTGGGLWVGCFTTSEFVHVDAGGEVDDVIRLPSEAWAVAPMLGGADGRTLFMVEADTTIEDLRVGRSSGRVLSTHVALGHAGHP
jgi:sugar lactone lactonase YvrE